MLRNKCQQLLDRLVQSCKIEKQGDYMKVQILGSGCAKCKLLEKNAREAVAELALEAEVVKVSDIESIMAMGVMSTPALAIDVDACLVGMQDALYNQLLDDNHLETL